MKIIMTDNNITFSSFKCPSNSPNNYTDHEIDTLLLYKHYLNGLLSLPVIILGILANSITISALLHRYLRNSSTNAYLMALSFSNLMSLLCLLIMVAIRFTFVYPYRLIYCKHWYENFVSLVMPYMTPINHLFQLSGIYLIMAVSIDRLVLIKSKMKPNKTNKKKRKIITWTVILCIFLFCFLFTLPNWFVIKSVLSDIIVLNNGTVLQLENNKIDSSLISVKISHYKNIYTEFGRDKLVTKLINIYLYVPFVFAIPIIVLFIVNVLIILELIKINKKKKQLGKTAQINRNITIMLVLIVILFLICQVPLAISHVVVTYKPYMMREKAFFIYQAMTSFLTCINLSANFGLFCFFGKAFRDTIKFMFCLRDDLPDQTKRQASFFYDNSRRNTIISMFSTALSNRKSSRANSAFSNYVGKNNRARNKSMPALVLFDNKNVNLDDVRNQELLSPPNNDATNSNSNTRVSFDESFKIVKKISQI